MRERDVENYLVTQVKRRGGEVRKVKWIGRKSAPDRLVMLPDRGCYWVELKAPGKRATFPSNAHERAQKREHDRMRAMGQEVFVIDDYSGVDFILI